MLAQKKWYDKKHTLKTFALGDKVMLLAKRYDSYDLARSWPIATLVHWKLRRSWARIARPTD